ncbi:arylamine N-acetyltransferase family protein [Flavobacterium sp. '19STA2R22 D10 B1']|uniref:arylamine N-acetyltransferase family protein n=1 Tax=Flavobacterium aerium TaxID=3037261 RepID=UPI00278C5F78|nr:arylamine N-acetyltransferase [Flavobacterium sp. '19STA2R22 D10 B1']
MIESKNIQYVRADNFVLQDYLDRIQFTGQPNLSLESIRRMMQCQIFTVPFEDLDVQAGKSVSLVGNEIVDKIIYRNRGGYCYEINGIFGLALQQIGIQYQFVAARPLVHPSETPKTHMAIIATIEKETYLIDLGFGGNSIWEPFKLSNIGVEVKQGPETFALELTEEGEYLLKMIVNKEWASLYSFNLSPQKWIDFKPANHYNSTHPDSFFVNNLVVVLRNPLGKKILHNNTIKSIKNGETETYTFENDKLEEILKSEFNLER